jgi:hypothetical protein
VHFIVHLDSFIKLSYWDNLISNTENNLFEYKNGAESSSSSERSFNDSEFAEYSFDEIQFWNVDENPSRNHNFNRRNKTLQVHESLKLSVHGREAKNSPPNHFESICHSRPSEYPFLSDKKIKSIENNEKPFEKAKKESSAVYNNKLSSQKNKKSLKRLGIKHDKRQTFTDPEDYHQEAESFDNLSSSYIEEEDLDEGYAYSQFQDASRPEHTPEENQPEIEQMHSQFEENKSWQKPPKMSSELKPHEKSYQTQEKCHNSRNLGKNSLSGFSNASQKKMKSQHKSTSSLHAAQSFHDRMKQFEETRKERALKMREEQGKHPQIYSKKFWDCNLENKELKECTFRPRIKSNRTLGRQSPAQSSSKRAYKKKRNITEFLKDQKEFQEKKFKRLEELSKEREKKECQTFRPKIDKHSKIITENDNNLSRNIPVYSRLHDMSKKNEKDFKSYVDPVHSRNRSNNFLSTKHNYITERFNISSALSDAKRRWKSKDMNKKKNLHHILYEDAFNRKSSKIKKNKDEELKEQSIRSFIKQTQNKTQNNHLSSYWKTFREKTVHNISSFKNASKRLSNGSPENCKSSNRLHKWGSTHLINQRFKPNKISNRIGDDFRRKMSQKWNIKNDNVLNWLTSSNSYKEQWVKKQKEKLAEKSKKEWTFHPSINKSSSKGKFFLRPNDKFTELYQKARKERRKSKGKTREEIEFEKQKEEWSFRPKINKQFLNWSNNKSKIEVRKQSNSESNPEITSKPMAQQDLDYVSKKIEELKNSQFFESYNDGSESRESESEPSPESPPMIQKMVEMNPRLTSETPKTEELEEELRDQVHDYQNPIFHDNFGQNEMNIQDMNQIFPAFDGPNFNEENAEFEESEVIDDEHPLLFIDVNLGPDKAERIVVFEGDTADDLATRFAQRHNLNDIMREKLQSLILFELQSLQ